MGLFWLYSGKRVCSTDNITSIRNPAEGRLQDQDTDYPISVLAVIDVFKQCRTMKIVVNVEPQSTQAKLILKPQQAIIKIPGSLTPKMQAEVRDKLIKVADMNKDTKQFLKLYYKIGTPYLFLNRKVANNKKETAEVYTYADL